MPYYEGGDMVNMWRRPEVNICAIAGCILQVSLAVNCLHQESVIHGDIKCRNIFLDDHDNAHLGDLGYARFVSGQKTVLTGPLGTSTYWSPERFDCESDDSVEEFDLFKCDVYALGVVCWVLVSKEVPVAGANYLAWLKGATHLNIPAHMRLAMELMLEPIPEKRATIQEVMTMFSSPKLWNEFPKRPEFVVSDVGVSETTS
ncbi:serine/threonine protein kinase [Elysia marginata]|uniref:Serine/threonine protein kinase n=1 Tax=Elysia marginata TaxID=1093978 RepID=A0AAV4GSW0_9GAST|nr:serine/threonine protein kinase [Elysia marginata]